MWCRCVINHNLLSVVNRQPLHSTLSAVVDAVYIVGTVPIVGIEDIVGNVYIVSNVDIVDIVDIVDTVDVVATVVVVVVGCCCSVRLFGHIALTPLL